MFQILFILILAIFLIGDGMFLLGTMGIGPFTEFVETSIMTVIIVFIAQIILICLVMYLTYTGPIKVLNRTISRFHAGLDNDTDMQVGSLSKEVNTVMDFFTKSLKLLRIFRDELREGRKLRSEVEIASEIQKQSISQKDDIIPGLNIAIGTASAAEVGGDSIDIVKGIEGNYYLYLGDVTGHGVASGFVMMMVSALVSSFAMRHISGAEILAFTNQILKPRIKTNMMMTCAMLRWDNNTKKMYFTGAGHEFILVYKAQENKVYKIKTGGVALGMVGDITKNIQEQQLAFEDGDLIILYTDGITEARYRSEQNGILFGIERLVEAIIKAQGASPEAVFRQITMDLSVFMGYQYKQYDDITLAIVGHSNNATGTTLTDISSQILPEYITEWNWGNPKKLS